MASCGIAYVLKYIQAAMQAGIEMGIYPKDAMRMVAQSVKGAAELILNNDTHPSVEIDKVCTPAVLPSKVSMNWNMTVIHPPSSMLSKQVSNKTNN